MARDCFVGSCVVVVVLGGCFFRVRGYGVLYITMWFARVVTIFSLSFVKLHKGPFFLLLLMWSWLIIILCLFDMCSPIAPQIICIDQFYFPTFELDIGMGNCTGPVSATLFIYLRYIGDNTNSSLEQVWWCSETKKRNIGGDAIVEN